MFLVLRSVTSRVSLRCLYPIACATYANLLFAYLVMDLGEYNSLSIEDMRGVCDRLRTENDHLRAARDGAEEEILVLEARVAELEGVVSEYEQADTAIGELMREQNVG